MRLQELLKRQRLQNHYTQAQLAEKLFVSTQAVSKWEHGQSVPTIDNLLMLSDLYNLSLDELVQGSPFLRNFISLVIGIDGVASSYCLLGG